jgi:hypothetical protein
MRQISSWGLVLVLLCSLERTSYAEPPPTAAIGLGMAIGGGGLTLLSGTLLFATATCKPDAHGEGCPPRVDQKAAIIGLALGIVSLGVGIPLYVTAAQSEKNAGFKQLQTELNAMSVHLSF